MISRLFKRFFYFSVILVVAVGTVKIYILWWDRHNTLNPDVVTAIPYTHTDKIPARGILIWREAVVPSRWNGTVTYPFTSPQRVGKGETLAVVSTSSGKMALKAESVGYFLSAIDGAEEKWNYSAFWNGMAPLPEPPPLHFFSPGARVEKGKPLGKIILQPQELRCILYADVTPSLERDIKAGFVRIKTEELGWARRAEVRVARFHDSKVKLYLTLPFFPPSFVVSREIFLFLETGERTGIIIPESAVVLREGRLGVLQVEGNIARFQGIKGLPVEGGRFFVTEGLSPGNVVLLFAQNAKEGKIRLW